MRRDLALVVALACAALLAAVFGGVPTWVRAPLLVPLVLFLPGYALAANLFAPGSVSSGERIVYAFALSIATTALAGVAVQIVFDLNRDSWALVLALLTVTIALRGVLVLESAPRRAIALPRAPLFVVASFAIAAVLVVAAIVSAIGGLRDAQARIRFTGFWLVPAAEVIPAPAGRSLIVGLRSHEGRRTRYRLLLRDGNRRIADQTIELRSGQAWEREISLPEQPGRGEVVATLRRDGTPYRSLYLKPEP